MSVAVRRALIALVVVVVALAVVVVGVVAIWKATQRHGIAETCTVGEYSVNPDQAAVASTMVGVVINRGLPERAAVLALAAGLQESKLRNLDSGEGDRDSVGVLQQRPSQGWGSEEQLNDVHYATGVFLDHVIKVANWQTDPLTNVVQAVQISAVPEGYARWEGQAQALADAFTGKTPAGISCSYPKPIRVATSSDVAVRLAKDLPIKTPTVSGTMLTVPGATWPTAAWLVANGDNLGLETVSYNGKTWDRAKGWKDDPKAPAGAVVAVPHVP